MYLILMYKYTKQVKERKFNNPSLLSFTYYVVSYDRLLPTDPEAPAALRGEFI
jgi:hypothetical protein